MKNICDLKSFPFKLLMTPSFTKKSNKQYGRENKRMTRLLSAWSWVVLHFNLSNRYIYIFLNVIFLKNWSLRSEGFMKRSPFLSLLSAIGMAVKLAESILWASRVKMKANPSSSYSTVIISMTDIIIFGYLPAFWKHWPCASASPKVLLCPLCSCSAAGDNGFFTAGQQPFSPPYSSSSLRSAPRQHGEALAI